MIGALLIEAPDVPLDVADELFLVWKIRFPYQGAITKHPHALARSRRSGEKSPFTVDDDVDDDHVARQYELCLIPRVTSSSFSAAT